MEQQNRENPISDVNQPTNPTVNDINEDQASSILAAARVRAAEQPPAQPQPAQPLPAQQPPAPFPTPAPTPAPTATTHSAMPPINSDPTAPAPTSTPTISANSIVSASSLREEDGHKRRSLPKKPLLICLLALLLIGGGGVGAYFGYVVPNKPANIWKTALSQTAKAYDRIPGYVDSTNFSKGVKLDGSFNVKSASFNADGIISGTSDNKNNGNISGSISVSGAKVDFNLLTIASTTSAPDLYFKVEGLQSVKSLLGAYGADPSISSAITSLDGKWYFVDHTLLEQSAGQSSATPTSISKKDVTDFINALGGPTKKYILTSNSQNMSVIIKDQIGKEKQDGLSVYHYKVGINKYNLKKWNTETCDSIKNNKLYEMLSLGQTQAELDKQCYDTSDIDSIKDSQTADAWVDLHTKLIHRIRIHDSQNASIYYDLTQNYQSGSKIPLGVSYTDNSGADHLTVSINATYDTGNSTLVIKGGESSTGSSAATASLSFTLAPNNSPVTVQKPGGATNVMQLINNLGLSNLLQNSSSPAGSLPMLQ